MGLELLGSKGGIDSLIREVIFPSIELTTELSACRTTVVVWTCSPTGSRESGGSLGSSEASQNISGIESVLSKASKASSISSRLAVS